MWLIVSIVLIQLFNDKQNISECKCVSGKILLVLHHLLQAYILFGGYVSNPKLHILVLGISFAAHYLNNRLCPITVLNNRICDFPKKKQLHTMLNVIEPHPKRVVCVYYFLISIAFLYDLFRINKGI